MPLNGPPRESWREHVAQCRGTHPRQRGLPLCLAARWRNFAPALSEGTLGRTGEGVPSAAFYRVVFGEQEPRPCAPHVPLGIGKRAGHWSACSRLHPLPRSAMRVAARAVSTCHEAAEVEAGRGPSVWPRPLPVTAASSKEIRHGSADDVDAVEERPSCSDGHGLALGTEGGH